MNKIIIYSTPTCTYCKLAKDYFNQKGIAFEEHDVLADMDKRKEMVDRSGQLGVPVILIGDEVIVGFDKERIEALLSK